MATDYEKRQKRREIQWPSDCSTSDLLQKVNDAEERISELECRVKRYTEVIRWRQKQTNKISNFGGMKAADHNPEMLFLDDDDDELENFQKEEIVKDTRVISTPRRPIAVPFRGSSSNPFGFSPNVDPQLGRDPQRARNQKLNELIEGSTLEDLQIWLKDTGWFNEAHKASKLKELKRQDKPSFIPKAIDKNAKQFGKDTPLADAAGSNRTPVNVASGRAWPELKLPSIGDASPPSSGFHNRSGNGDSHLHWNKTPWNQQQRHVPSRASEPAWRLSHGGSMSRDAQHDRSWSAREARRSDSQMPALSRRSRSPSPSVARDHRRRANTDPDGMRVDPRRGTINRRDRERAGAENPADPPPLRRNQRVSPRPHTPPRPDGIVVGASGGWGKPGGWDSGHSWMTEFKPLER